MKPACKIGGCISEQHARGLCNTHYRRLKKYGDADAARPIRKVDRLQWIFDHVDFAEDRCLIWPFGRWPRGHVSVVKFEGKFTAATRVMCQLASGKPPSPRYEAAHNCGNGHDACINPTHLYWGTHRQNMADTVEHGTATRGTQNGRATIAESVVRAIRKSDGLNIEIAHQFKVSPSIVSRIRRGKTWAHLK